MGLMEAVGRGPVALDSSVFIYFIEGHPRFAPLLRPLFATVHAGRVEAVTSAITLLEVLVVPLRSGQSRLAARYEAFLTWSRGLTLHAIEPPSLKVAAWLRATTGASTPDALQLATALAEGCTAFVTNDRRIPEVPGLRVIQLEQVA